MSTAGSGIDFFVGYAEAEGALAERVPEGVVLVLTEEMRAVLNLPEAIGLTEDPETAREDAFLLVTTGHPLLMAAAGAVLERGDVGCSSLPRPARLPPTSGVLEDTARGQIHSDHGRIDVTGTPEASNVVLLRVGALLTYSISIDERVQEVEEAWVVADSGRTVPAGLHERLRAIALEPGVAPGIMPPTAEGVAKAHDLLRARARRRVDDLARQTSARLRGQLEVVDGYYERVLSSVDERLRRASGDRVAMLAEQAEATRREWARRRSEVADDLTPSFQVQPFRLHLVAVPSYTVQAVVRRGDRAYPVPLTYLPVVSSFVPPLCPSCDSEAVLVAGKSRLGCRSCMVSPPPPRVVCPADQVEDEEPIVTGPHQVEDEETASGPGDRSATKLVRSERRPSGGPPRPTAPTRMSPSRASSIQRRSTGRVTPKGSVGGPATAQSGARVALSFWSSVRSGELRPRDAVPHSPMRALLRLYGPLGPALVIGIEDAGWMTAVSTSPVSQDDGGTCSTVGELQRSGEDDASFALFWRPGSRSNLLEVEGFPLEQLGPLLARRDEYGRICRRRFREFLIPPPAPIVVLDPTAEVLLDRAAQFAGLGYAVRCMAAWWYVTEGDDAGGLAVDHLDRSMAAAIESAVGKRLGMRTTVPALAERYECPAESVRRHLKIVQSAVRTCSGLRW